MPQSRYTSSSSAGNSKCDAGLGNHGKTLSIFIDEAENEFLMTDAAPHQKHARYEGRLIVLVQQWKAIFTRFKQISDELVA